MEATELRIGNWISINDGEKPAYNYCIAHGLDIEKIDGYGEDCSGVLLTPELLKKCGFELLSGGTFQNIINDNYAKDGICLFFNKGDDNTYFLAHGFQAQNRKYFAATARWVKTLHEVQNYYYAITGKELTVTL